MNSNSPQQVATHSSLCLLGLLSLILFTTPVAAQVFDLGPSPSASFDNVINLPNDGNIGQFQTAGGDGLSTQLNISNGGSVGGSFNAESGTEVNINGGSVGILFTAESGSEVNISDGSIGALFGIRSGSVANVSGGSVDEVFNVFAGGVANISGGDIGILQGRVGSEINISGGSFDDGYVSEGLANISGGTFDSSFFVRASSVVNISDGTFDGVLSLDGEANISGGNFSMLQTFLIGVVNISGGNFAPDSISESGGNFNLFGSNFFLDGVSLDGRLTEGQAFTIEDRNVTLTSVLADGSPFSYNLPSAENPAFNPDINLTVTLVSSVPEPGSLTLIGLGSVILLALRRKTCVGDLEVHLGLKMKPINGAR